MLTKPTKSKSAKTRLSRAPAEGLDAFAAALPHTYPNPDSDRIRTAVTLMAKMIDDRPLGVELDFRRIQYAALAGALALSATALPATWSFGDYSL
jgi:hypothetical protein